ncbi:hypothetical protein [Winogradskyella immobilis]|uniref:Uncharacterized protein n=1 Tax=Winogradskyella immobilis TaxID=2816852 RepID=A0ABS8EPF9_9FLAO|nr:hypothetical protein [Winogradskyella immobilis]MCC1485104.1 hypothetical protein [Winogradskyella immobilis]MCG0017196.1 hypothetical protein [Winogradskyella immobilis]
MRSALFYFLFFLTSSIIAQSQLTSASAKVDMSTEVISVTETLNFKLPDSIHNITLKALKFQKIAIEIIEVISEDKNLDFQIIPDKGLHQIRITSKEQIKSINLNYKVDVKNNNIQIPLFFTDLSAATSENDFFIAEIKTNSNDYLNVLFPNVDLNESMENELKILRLEIPALPSVLRLERLSTKEKGFTFLSIIDGLVALIFVVIGILIWRNRKRLIYG